MNKMFCLCPKDRPYEPLSFSREAFQTLAGNSTLALAQDDPRALPNETIEYGEKAIDAVGSYVKSCFPDSQQSLVENNNDWKELIDLFNLNQLKEFFCTDSRFPTVEAFVEGIAQSAKKNPILLALGAAYFTGLDEKQQKTCFPQNDAEQEEEVRHATTYCYLLHTITHTILEEPKGVGKDSTFIEQIVNLFSGEREVLEWKPHFDAFEKLKEASINPAIQEILGYKNGTREFDTKTTGGALLSINILEAMMQDVLKGNDENAKCGFELMMESNDRKEIKGTGNGPDDEWVNNNGQATGIILYKCPLPTVWSNLYSSWNLCFCTNYSNYPEFFAKLLNPATFGSYHDVKGMYLCPRVICLYGHLQYTITTRAKAKSKNPPFGDWSSKILSQLWGVVNREAARQYQERLEAIIDDNYGFGTEIAYDLKRTAVRPLWGTLSAMIKVYKNLKRHDDGGEGKVKLFESLNVESTDAGLLQFAQQR